MIYATPLDIDKDNVITSRVLESFKYNSDSKTIEWIVKAGLRFEDGSVISPDDVAFAVARMAYARPNFPLLTSIIGVEDWSKSEGALRVYPTGIRVNGQKISIQFSHTVIDPLLPFSLGLFSIIPRRCVDPSTNRISCWNIPESGRYKLDSQTLDTVAFSRRSSEIDVSLPLQIQFNYVEACDVPKRLGKLDSRTVLTGTETDFPAATLNALGSTLNLVFLTKAPFGDKSPRKRKFLAAKNQSLFRHLEIAATPPAPWQVFKT